jgi:hypothetical protein
MLACSRLHVAYRRGLRVTGQNPAGSGQHRLDWRGTMGQLSKMSRLARVVRPIRRTAGGRSRPPRSAAFVSSFLFRGVVVARRFDAPTARLHVGPFAPPWAPVSLCPLSRDRPRRLVPADKLMMGVDVSCPLGARRCRRVLTPPRRTCSRERQTVNGHASARRVLQVSGQTRSHSIAAGDPSAAAAVAPAALHAPLVLIADLRLLLRREIVDDTCVGRGAGGFRVRAGQAERSHS